MKTNVLALFLIGALALLVASARAQSLVKRPASRPAIDQPVANFKENPDAPKIVELKPENILDIKGDGPDGKANTDDDTWGFWFELVHAPGTFERLDVATLSMTEDEQKNGVVDKTAKHGPGKIRGPVASMLPNPNDTEGWIFHSDWDGRFEGVWADKKVGCVMMYPYVEKTDHRAVALTYRIPATGNYTISGKITDLMVVPEEPKHDGITWRIEIATANEPGATLKRGDPIGDGHGRPDSADFKLDKVKIGAGRLVRLVIHPNAWWGTDLTRVDLKIERVE